MHFVENIKKTMLGKLGIGNKEKCWTWYCSLSQDADTHKNLW